MIITKLVVVDDGVVERQGDHVWHRAIVDDGDEIRKLKVTVRTFLHEGHPLEVYINGADPLYPTVVYNTDGQLLGVSAGLLGVGKVEDD